MTYPTSYVKALEETVRREKINIKHIQEGLQHIGVPTGEYSKGYTDALKMELAIHQKVVDDTQQVILEFQKERNR